MVIFLLAEFGKKFLYRVDDEIQKECNEYFKQKIFFQFGDGKVLLFLDYFYSFKSHLIFKVVLTSAHEMKNFNYVFHAVTLNMDKNGDLKKSLETLFRIIFHKCELLKIKPIALPLLGSGMNQEKYWIYRILK